jgi:hypothetical protein
MGAFPLNRLHYTARREVGRGAQQMDMVGTDMPLQDLDVLTSTDFPEQIAGCGRCPPSEPACDTSW